jgi:hypothetical protein
MTSYPYSDPFDRFADCRYTERKPALTHTICPICGERIEVDEDIVKVDKNVTYHRECFESDLWEILEPLGVELGTMPEEEEFYDAITEFCD